MTKMISAMRHFRHPNPKLPFSAAVQVGDIVYLSGQIGVQADGTLPEGIVEQTHQTMRNLAASAQLAGLGTADIFKCTVMLADMSMWPAFNEVYLAYFDAERLPARSAFGSNGLAFGALVEVEALAFADGHAATPA